MKYEAIAITGPTASGKTGKAVGLASEISGEIISADSRQVYTGMDLGTGKDLEEYGDVAYHLIDIAPAGSKYNLHKYIQDFEKVYSDILERGKIPVICGGTGMYLENALSGIRLPEVPENPGLREKLEGKSLEELTAILESKKTLHNVTDVDTVKRAVRAIEIEEYYEKHPEEAEKSRRENAVPLHALIIGIDIPRDLRRERITSRLNQRLENGMMEEIRTLLSQGVKPEDLIYYGLEYKFLTLHAIGELTYQEMFTALETAIHQFAKRQMTWFRGMERRGFHIHWLPFDMPQEEFNSRVLELAEG